MTAHPDETDVVVVGSGGVALVAALAATEGGLRVTVIERSGYVGGTTALSTLGYRAGQHAAGVLA